jgi:hypothetical protein
MLACCVNWESFDIDFMIGRRRPGPKIVADCGAVHKTDVPTKFIEDRVVLLFRDRLPSRDGKFGL